MAQLQGKARADYVRGMFDRIAGRYDLMNRLITAGQDRKWRRFAVQMTALPARGRLLDIATGTGDIALETLRQQPTARVHGADFALEMMRVGQARRGGDGVAWAGADALRLPYADASFDAVVSAYLLRNVINIPQALAEQRRVLRSGGRIVILDTSPPPATVLKPLINLHLKVGIPLLGRLVAGKAAADAYRYLPESTALFKTPQELAGLVEAAGFGDVRYRVFMLGTMAVHWGRKA
ncbi:MAG: ubiquinone/menaquinone biosynthesis methyltransferase [Chloroflexi bacterium]|nr:ubiquinone/menaquinone biosynthesis methyltransferase [Chloroflexota bacterium]MCY3582097.1 ubiquinone/menaquinone biosynthesis methyltransferase [Chloroflexota bacterium]MCY3715553.1 ubiquinone/menaquinone biosynthesis methyltransferase [Chloroflexota bacterium]MDE2650709.1 ubiquinone/menaquinone biosynthesis methyltransferase [Chloroflexota bacterium]MXV94204.1 ubiquinone/menaquinone biosynthesis methyltransferase [Chloroflexota bacterium]